LGEGGRGDAGLVGFKKKNLAEKLSQLIEHQTAKDV
jgi:hypothetical protein